MESHSSVTMNSCRICWEDAPTTSLLEPCLCRGSVRYVHPLCLFRELDARNHMDFADAMCRVCGSPYELSRPKNDITRQAIFASFMVFTYTIVFVHRTFLISMLLSMLSVNMLICATPFALRLQNYPGILHILVFGGVVVVIHDFHPLLPIITAGLLPLMTNIYWMTRDITFLRFVAGCLLMVEFNILLYAMYLQPSSNPVALLLFSLMSVLPLSIAWSMV